MHWTFTKILPLALAAALLNLLPRLLAAPGADVVFHYAMINCFSEQFWQGDWYPRWCMSANAGLGAGLYLFYFPGAYYVTALLYPLHFLAGMGVQDIYLASIGLANVVAFLTCWYWLRDIVSPGRAVLCALLFLFLPYRMELIMYRSAFSELWGVSLLPLLFLAVRRFIADDRRYWPALAAAIALCLLTHVPATIGGLMACGVQVLLLTGRRRAPKLRFALTVALAGAATAFYTVPAKYFLQYIAPASLTEIPTIWANGYVHWVDFTDRVSIHAHLPIMINMSISILLVAALAFMAWRRRARIPDAAIRREMLAWGVIAALATLMLFPVSAPLWWLLGPVSVVTFPWRIQSLIMFAAAYFIAVRTQWLMTPKQMKTWKADYLVGLLLFAMLGLFVLNGRVPEVAGLFDRVVRAHVVHVSDYRTRWTNPYLDEPDHVLARFENPSPPPRAAVASGKGRVEVRQWSWRGIALSATMAKPGTIRLQHFYFPIWRMTLDGADSNGLSPEPHSGLMLLRLPAGEHRIFLRRDLGHAMGWLYGFVNALSLLTAAFLVWMMRRR